MTLICLYLPLSELFPENSKTIFMKCKVFIKLWSIELFLALSFSNGSFKVFAMLHQVTTVVVCYVRKYYGILERGSLNTIVLKSSELQLPMCFFNTLRKKTTTAIHRPCFNSILVAHTCYQRTNTSVMCPSEKDLQGVLSVTMH